MKTISFIPLLIFFISNLLSCTSYYNYDEAGRFRDIREGQTSRQVVGVLGEPEKAESFLSGDEVAEIWIFYHDYLTPCASSCERYYYAPILYLIFEDDILVNKINMAEKEE